MKRIAQKCETLTGRALQAHVDGMSGEQARETLKMLARIVETEGGTRVVIGFRTLDQVFRALD